MPKAQNTLNMDEEYNRGEKLFSMPIICNNKKKVLIYKHTILKP